MGLFKRLSSSGAIFVALGIFLSRIAGLIREKVFAYYFGSSVAGDVFRAALRIPNMLQNLLGEGVLSGSFIPVYAKLVAENKIAEARKLAGAVLGLLCALTTLIVVLGVFASPLLIDLIAPGFDGERRELCIRLVQWLFPGLGFLVLSAFCLGVLNSHRKFFLSYSAPVLWNASIIGSLFIWGPKMEQNSLALHVGYGVVVGCILQFLVQVPLVLRLLGGLHLSLSFKTINNDSNLRVVLKNFFPLLTGRGVVQISAYIDTFIASFLPIGALSIISYAQTLYLLPISLFGMSISAAELPVMSQARGSEMEVAAILRARVIAASRKIAFFIIPCIVAFIFLGPYILRILYQGGAFTSDTRTYVWIVLIASALGLLPSTLGRVLSSSFYALREAKIPLRMALIRVAVSIALGLVFALYGPKLLNVNALYGSAGLTFAFTVSGFLEWRLLKAALELRIGSIALPFSYFFKLILAAFIPGLGGSILLFKYPQLPNSIAFCIAVLAVYGVVFGALAYMFKIQELRYIVRKKS